MSPWVAALLSWALATGLVTAVYTAWRLSQGKPMRWDLVGEAALIAVPLALFRAWRDGRKNAGD
jgi:RsiW-degrading membrane proteinase PrsW (M82 family)